MLYIRMASLDDVKGIVEVHCSGVDKWYKWVDGRRIEASYDELSVLDRWGHGGPWMSIETCAIHINYVLVHNQYPLVALLDGKIVGELELYIGKEKGVLGKTAFIDILEVHRDYRRRGIGRSLVNKAIEIAKERNCDTVSVWPAKEAVGFYKKCGFNTIAYNIVNAELDIENIKPHSVSYDVKEFPSNYNVLEDTWFISPRIESSFTAWIKSRWKYAVEEEVVKTIEGYIPGLQTAFIIESLWMNKDTASLYLWIKDVASLPEAIDTMLEIARNAGFKKLRLIIDKNIYERYVKNYQHKIIEQEIVLSIKL
ncbi:GNAT family N-acetyltransferase [Desulfurococcaceae archaeon MEX13E-LK6-19]|nr:GNAT family N-acetyltransferase [Desulfurococcaceae archaeon MEX13E-LK6-19]